MACSLLVVLVVVLGHPVEELRDNVTGSFGQGAGELIAVELKESQRNKLEGEREGGRGGSNCQPQGQLMRPSLPPSLPLSL